MNPYQKHFKKLSDKPSLKSNKQNTFNLPGTKKKRNNARSGKSMRTNLILFVLTVAVGLTYLFFEDVFEAFDMPEVHFGPKAQAQLRPATISEAKDKSAQLQTTEEDPNAQKKLDIVSEDPSYLGTLRNRKEELDKKELELKELALELQRQREQLDLKIGELDKMRGEISQILQERVNTDEGRVAKLVEFYSSMKPVNAAQVFEKLDEDLAIEILSKMKKQSAAEIMNAMKVEKAQKLSEKFAGYRSN